MPKLYTKKGDRGTSGLYDGARLDKCEDVFQALGDIDELSAAIGILLTLPSVPAMHRHLHSAGKGVYDSLRGFQGTLINVGSLVATRTPNRREKLIQITDDDVKDLENKIDELEKENDPLTQFILPGTSQHDAHAHMCRAVARRAERSVVRVHAQHPVPQPVLKYLNRLSDYFFALARYLAPFDVTTADLA